MPGNQQNVANSVNNFFNGGGTLTPNFVTIFGLSGGNLNTALAQLSGKSNTAADQASFQLMSGFLGIMTDPSVDGRGGRRRLRIGIRARSGGGISARHRARLCLRDQEGAADRRHSKIAGRRGARASAVTTRPNGDPPPGPIPFTARAFGFAGGLDYHVDAETVVGFALAGSGGNWSLVQNLGTGRGNSFQFGVYGTSPFGTGLSVRVARHHQSLG